jgi:hypothetical protein
MRECSSANHGVFPMDPIESPAPAEPSDKPNDPPIEGGEDE